MPLTFSFAPASRRVDTTANGPVTLAEIVTHLERQRADGVLGCPEYIDASRATAAFTPSDVRHLVDILQELRRASPLGPVAVLVADDLSFGMVRMLGILIEEVCDIRPFRDHVAAAVWLSQVSAPGTPPSQA